MMFIQHKYTKMAITEIARDRLYVDTYFSFLFSLFFVYIHIEIQMHKQSIYHILHILFHGFISCFSLVDVYWV